jgi:hypothetical protein
MLPIISRPLVEEKGDKQLVADMLPQSTPETVYFWSLGHFGWEE